MLIPVVYGGLSRGITLPSPIIDIGSLTSDPSSGTYIRNLVATNNPDGAPTDCKGHGSLGSGWDFSQSAYPNAGLTLCGGDGSNFLASSWGGGWTYYGTAGGAQAIWVR